MRILLKCPTRSRPQKIQSTLASYVRLANRPDLLGVAVSCDEDDPSMKDTSHLLRTLSPCAWKRVFYSANKTKIEACNANVNEVDWDWDIVVLVSDDMIPQIRGYDDIIRNHMLARFPDTNGILWFNDGAQGDKLNTLTIFGRAMYNSFGFLYHPSYKSLFCDTELTDQCRTTHADRCLYVPFVIIRHEHPGTGYAQNMDALYAKNQRYWSEDMFNYISRKAYPTDVSFLIPTIPGREVSLQTLVQSIREKCQRLAPTMRICIQVGFDNKEQSIGLKREFLLQGATGKYACFIDDDDDITDAYIEDLWGMVQGEYHVMRLRGQMSPYTFTHSIENTLSGPMARGEVFLRPPNHLNPMMTDVAKLVHFRDAKRGEDLDWTLRMSKAGYLTREYRSDPERIHYLYQLNGRVVSRSTLELQYTTTFETMLQMIWTPGGAVAPQQTQAASGGNIPILRLGPRGFVSSK